MNRNGWPLSTVISGQFEPESMATLDRIMQTFPKLMYSFRFCANFSFLATDLVTKRNYKEINFSNLLEKWAIQDLNLRFPPWECSFLKEIEQKKRNSAFFFPKRVLVEHF